MNEPIPEPSEIYLRLRDRVLSLSPDELGMAPTIEAPHVWGVMMETSYDVGSATLVSLADGTTSLYYSTGGGMLGSGDYLPVAQASQAFIEEAETHWSEFSAGTDFPLPEVGKVRFILLTYTGKRSEDASEEELLQGDHPLSGLFSRAQEALAQLRESASRKSRKQ
jgi:hypothetical protein